MEWACLCAETIGVDASEIAVIRQKFKRIQAAADSDSAGRSGTLSEMNQASIRELDRRGFQFSYPPKTISSLVNVSQLPARVCSSLGHALEAVAVCARGRRHRADDARRAELLRRRSRSRHARRRAGAVEAVWRLRWPLQPAGWLDY